MTDTEKKEKPDLLKQMSSVVSHEIRNPLAIISNSLYFIKTKLSAGGAELDPKISKHVGIIEGEVKHSNEVIEEMLSFTRPRELQLAPAQMNAGVDDASGFPVPEGINIEKSYDEANPKVNVDIEAMRYALRCVLKNAVQAMPEGGTLKIEASHDDAMAHLSFTDTGHGFKDCDGEKVFEPFFTTRPRGIGLGLPIVRKYVELHGGKVKAEKAGGGVKVTISLPMLK